MATWFYLKRSLVDVLRTCRYARHVENNNVVECVRSAEDRDWTVQFAYRGAHDCGRAFRASPGASRIAADGGACAHRTVRLPGGHRQGPWHRCEIGRASCRERVCQYV